MFIRNSDYIIFLSIYCLVCSICPFYIKNCDSYLYNSIVITILLYLLWFRFLCYRIFTICYSDLRKMDVGIPLEYRYHSSKHGFVDKIYVRYDRSEWHRLDMLMFGYEMVMSSSNCLRYIDSNYNVDKLLNSIKLRLGTRRVHDSYKNGLTEYYIHIVLSLILLLIFTSLYYIIFFINHVTY